MCMIRFTTHPMLAAFGLDDTPMPEGGDEG
jgi:hypothetical protein